MRSSMLWLALLCHLALASAYALQTPTFEGPDENVHYEYAWHLANARELPLTPGLAAERGLPQTEAGVLAHHPPLYYALLALPLLATGTDDTVFAPRLNPDFGNPTAASRHLRFLHEEQPSRVLLMLRMVSVLLGALTIICVHRTGLACCPDAPAVADLAAILTACLPMWTFLHGVCSNDVLATLLASATLLALVRALRAERLTPWRALSIGAMLGCAWLSKLTTLYLGAIAGLVALVLLWRARRTGTVGRTLVLSLVAAATALAISGWWFWRNWMLLGDPLAMNAHDESFLPIPAELRWHYLLGTAPWPANVPSFLPTVFTSLFGRFGWFSLPPHAALLWCGAVVAATALIGLVRTAFDRERSFVPRPLWPLLLTLSLVFAGTAWFNLTAPQPQARLLFPAVAPAAVLLAAGLVRITRGLPLRRWLVLLLPAVAVLVFAYRFLPAFDPVLARAPTDHRSLVGNIAGEVLDPAIIWPAPLPAEPLTAPPTLRWRDPSAPEGTRYTLYAYDRRGRVWLATHEWTKGELVIRGAECAVPEQAWQFLPIGVPLSFKIRRLPLTPTQAPADLPSSSGLPFVRR